MENNKFWIYLGLGVVAAFAMKWFVTPESSSFSKRWSLQAGLEEEIQFKRTSKVASAPSPLLQARRTTPLLAQIKSGATTTAPAAKKEDPKKAQNVAKKKDDKKKKKRKKRKGAIPAPTIDDGNGDDDNDSEAIAAGGGSAAPQDGAQTVAGGVRSEKERTLEDWEQILLATPNYRETTRFISLYQARQVKSEVFYGIVGQMLNDGRVQMRQLGVMSLGSTPSLESYVLLITSAESEQGVTKSQANRYIDSYNQPQNLGVIYQALTRPGVSLNAMVQALKNLDTAAKNNVPNRNPGNSQPEIEGPLSDLVSAADITTPDTQEVQPVARDFKYRDSFRSFQGLLLRLSESAPNEEVRSLAAAALVSVNTLVAATAPAGTSRVAGN